MTDTKTESPSGSGNNFQAFQAVCDAQTLEKDWMKQWPGSVDLQEIARILRPLALSFKGVEKLSDDEVLAAFFTDQAVKLLANLRNTYCFWVIAREAAWHIGDYSLQITLPNVVAAMEARPDVPRAIVT